MQQINLYHSSLIKKKITLSFSHLVQGSIGLLVLITVIQAYNEYTYYSSKSLLIDKQQQLVVATKNFALLKSTLPKLNKDPSLALKLKQLDKDLSSKKVVLSILSDKKLGNTAGFTSHFEGLARRAINGLWITRAHFIKGGTILDIQGKSQQPELVPQYLQALSSEEAFKGTEFNSFVIQHDSKNKIHEFKLNNLSSGPSSKMGLTSR